MMSTEDEIEAARRRLYDVTHGVADALDKAKAPVEGFAGLMKGLGVGQVNATKGAEALGRALAEQLSITGAVTKGLGTLTKQLASGNADLTVFNTVIDTTAGLVGGLSKTIPYLGEAINAVVKAAAEAAKIVLARFNDVGKAFIEIGEVGGVAGKGLDGIAEQAKLAGLSLESYKKAVIGNSTVMARWQNTAAAGAEEFSKLSGSIAKYDSAEGLSLRRLGKGTTELTDGVAGFLTQQIATGLAQRKTTEQLRVGAIEYIKELDIMTRMTGVSAKAMQEQEKAALTEARFAAQTRSMEKAGQLDASKNLKDLSRVVSATKPVFGRAIRDLSSGVANTEAGRALQTATGGAAIGIIQEVTSGLTSWPEALKKLQDAMGPLEDNMLLQAQFGDANNKMYGELHENIKFITNDMKASYDSSVQEQSTALANQTKMTEAWIEAQRKVEATQRKMDAAAFGMMEHAATAAEKMAKGLDHVVDIMLEKFGDESTMYKVIDKTVKGISTVAGAALGGMAGSSVPIVGTAAGAMAGGAAGYVEGGMISKYLTDLLGVQQYKTKNAEGGNQAEPANRSSSGTIRGLDHPAGPSGPSSEAPKTNPDEQGIKNTVLTKKAQLETMLGKKLAITSGFRAGSANHGSGDAIDLGLVSNKLSEIEKNKLIKSAIDLGFTGIGAEYNAPGGPHIHLDTSHASLVGWGSDYTSKSLGIDSPYAAALINARRSGQQDPGLASAANGGVLSGPRSGYSATLHGTEAVVPLPDGRSIPISNSGGGGGSMEIQAAQLGALEELVSTMKNQVSISSKMLQYAQ